MKVSFHVTCRGCNRKVVGHTAADALHGPAECAGCSNTGNGWNPDPNVHNPTKPSIKWPKVSENNERIVYGNMEETRRLRTAPKPLKKKRKKKT